MSCPSQDSGELKDGPLKMFLKTLELNQATSHKRSECLGHLLEVGESANMAVHAEAAPSHGVGWRRPMGATAFKGERRERRRLSDRAEALVAWAGRMGWVWNTTRTEPCCLLTTLVVLSATGQDPVLGSRQILPARALGTRPGIERAISEQPRSEGRQDWGHFCAHRTFFSWCAACCCHLPMAN